MAGLDPAISLRESLFRTKRDHRDKPGDDKMNGSEREARRYYFCIVAGVIISDCWCALVCG